MSDPQRLWSVTTMVKLGLGTRDALVNWAVNTASEYAIDNLDVLAPLAARDRAGAIKLVKDSRWASSSKAAARGTDVHKAAEALALGQPIEVEPHVQPYVDQYLSFLDRHAPEFLMSEAPVYNPTYGYAGTCDGIMQLDGKRVVFDLKTTAHAPDSGKSRPPFPEVALQLVAYRRAELVGVMSEMRYASGKRYYLYNPDAQHAVMPETDGAVCIVISPYDLMVVPVRTDDEVWGAWRHVMECARWQVATSRNVFGPPITTPAKETVA